MIKTYFICLKLVLQRHKYWILEDKLIDHKNKIIDSYAKYKNIDESNIQLEIGLFRKLMIKWKDQLDKEYGSGNN